MLAESGMALIDWEASWAKSETAIAVGMVVAAVLSVAMVLIIRARANKNQAEERA